MPIFTSLKADYAKYSEMMGNNAMICRHAWPTLVPPVTHSPKQHRLPATVAQTGPTKAGIAKPNPGRINRPGSCLFLCYGPGSYCGHAPRTPPHPSPAQPARGPPRCRLGHAGGRWPALCFHGAFCGRPGLCLHHHPRQRAGTAYPQSAEVASGIAVGHAGGSGW
jgi:hypothetical protein